MVGGQPVEQRGQVRRGTPYRGKQGVVFALVVAVQRSTHRKAGRPEPEQRCIDLQILEVSPHCGDVVVCDAAGQVPHGGEVASQYLVHPPQLVAECLRSAGERIGVGGGRTTPGGRVRAFHRILHPGSEPRRRLNVESDDDDGPRTDTRKQLTSCKWPR